MLIVPLEWDVSAMSERGNRLHILVVMFTLSRVSPYHAQPH
jgi:hypothetical protein